MKNLEEKYKQVAFLEDEDDLDKQQILKLYEEVQWKHPHITLINTIKNIYVVLIQNIYVVVIVIKLL